MKKTIIMLSVLLFVVIAATAQAATYYVSSSGSDSNPGTLTSPWKTIGKANSTLQAGDTVYIRVGTYSGDYVNPSRSGTSDTNRITYSNYNNEKVTVKDASYGVRINGKSYITVNGISFYNLVL